MHKLTYRQACDRMAEYIAHHAAIDTHGKEVHTIDPYTDSQGLIEMNRKGLITIDSQPGRTYKWEWSDFTKLYMQEKQRPYIEGWIATRYAKAFVTFINCNSNNIAYIITASNTPLRKIHRRQITVTAYNCRPGKTGPITQVMDESTLATQVYRPGYNTQRKSTYLDPKVKVELICIVDPRWGAKLEDTDGLYESILASLKSCQVKV
jgi:hypothetical protein